MVIAGGQTLSDPLGADHGCFLFFLLLLETGEI
jgi:hypothetical protein